MKQQWQALVFVAMAWMASMAPAHAIPVVAPDSTYVLYLAGLESGNDAAGEFRFDGAPETIPRGNGFLTVTENETVLDATSSEIIVTLSGTSDLFPAGNDVALLGIGTFGNGLDLLFPVRLAEAYISFLAPGGVLITETGNLVSEASQSDPWDGLFPNAFDLVGVEGVGGLDVQTVSFRFLVTTRPAEVPEPGILLLGGIGLLGFATARRRKAVKQA
ncbi:MAG: PEP-CTERM sorting domain-containing protein [Massilia sp.]|nr:MAG: PEP-CTERM sorting domain-containing protein [Massilia sp.]